MVAPSLRTILEHRAHALQAFFGPAALVLQGVRADLGVDHCLDAMERRGVQVSPTPDLRSYLLRHADLIDPVRVICDTAREQVGPDDEVALELYRDPEIRDENVAERVLAGTSGWVLVTTDFKPPV